MPDSVRPRSHMSSIAQECWRVQSCEDNRVSADVCGDWSPPGQIYTRTRTQLTTIDHLRADVKSTRTEYRPYINGVASVTIGSCLLSRKPRRPRSARNIPQSACKEKKSISPNIFVISTPDYAFARLPWLALSPTNTEVPNCYEMPTDISVGSLRLFGHAARYKL